MSQLPDDIDAAIGAAKARTLDDEPLTLEGAMLATQVCEKHCSVCDGEDHHWLHDLDDDGEPIVVCKHCPAWRDVTEQDLDDEEGCFE